MAIDLGKQVGPLPLGAWVAVIGTGIGVAVYARGGGSGTVAATPTRDTTTDPLTGEDATGMGPGWTAVPPPSTGPTSAAPPQDNDEWGRLAINHLIAQGYDPALSQSAIGNALQGNPMSIREFALWGTALRALGAPPYAIDVVPPTSVPGTTTPTTTPPPPAPAPALGKWWRVPLTGAWDMHRVSNRFYGSPSHWQKIYAVNRNGVARPKGVLPYPNPTPGWITTQNPDANLTHGRWLFIPR